MYPRGGRVDSSNISELLACKAWEAGVQMVCFNLQTVDGSTMLNRALFELNGGCGYVLKPRVTGEGMRLSVRILSVHNLPKTRDERCEPQAWDQYHPELSPNYFDGLALTPSDVVSPLVEVEVLGGKVCPERGNVDEATDRMSWSTAPKCENGLCASWEDGDTDGAFACDVWTPMHSFLRVNVHNSRNALLGGNRGKGALLASEVVPLQALRHGYRSLQLRSPNGCRIEACKMLLHIQLQPIVREVAPALTPRQVTKPPPRVSMTWSNLKLSALTSKGRRTGRTIMSPRTMTSSTS